MRTSGLPESQGLTAGINSERLYDYRFRDVDQAARQAVWREIARYARGRMGAPRRVLDPVAGWMRRAGPAAGSA